MSISQITDFTINSSLKDIVDTDDGFYLIESAINDNINNPLASPSDVKWAMSLIEIIWPLISGENKQSLISLMRHGSKQYPFVEKEIKWLIKKLESEIK
jgi:hypothetical protein